ncbi:MAG: hypothetical protein AAF228_08430 [Pseudomonadota bacterium]
MMAGSKKRVIIVSKDREADLHRYGKQAQDLFPQNPTSAYNQVIRQLDKEDDPIQYIDQDMTLDALPAHMGTWYFGMDDNDTIK